MEENKEDTDLFDNLLLTIRPPIIEPENKTFDSK